ncbi:histidine phosphotransferase family protein [Magnetospirillum sulfuroxidans]|uniref:Histidine phosphotransferase ChpT C-terminal domain-containing protein n=1 Tax=Magnetospirillum sulfuroxidans TaxID=611300 RepID=A0ABS5IFK8_9PROT|nr:histidine phosphotransferase family protein [Magnetospirillum sulfuroxidans]MBR9973051.1 hypothetical protein [Magnetospirillum sulfuroxidans]
MADETEPTQDILTLAELLCARVCHDLAGPVGATAAGAELFEDLGGGDAETLALVSTSASGAAARLRLLRAALGPAHSSPQSQSALRGLVDGHLHSQASVAAPAIVTTWIDCPDQIDGDRARLLLNLVLLGRDALPRGGHMELSLTDGWPALLAHGEPASLADDVKTALHEGGLADGPRAAQAVFTRLLAKKLSGHITATLTPRGLRVAVKPAD